MVIKFVEYDVTISKDSVKKHAESLQHKEAKRLETKSLLGAEKSIKRTLCE